MDSALAFQHTEVIDFLGCIPILQQLPAISINRIAESVRVKSFSPGELIAQEGELSEGLYFVWKGEAEVNTSTEEGAISGPTVPSLKSGDYFGHATVGPVKNKHKADIIAKTKVVCLVLDHERTNLLSPASIWCPSREDNVGIATMEQILQLENLAVDLYRAITIFSELDHVFGGQLLGQALAAASKSVDPALLVHSLHSYFVRTGDNNVPLLYQVHRIRDGHSFATRSVVALQNGHTIFHMMASFQRVEVGFVHQEAMPSVPDPEKTASVEALKEAYLTDPRIPISYRKKLLKRKVVPGPLDIRLCDPEDRVKPVSTDPSQKLWFRARGTLSDDQALQRCVAAYASDTGLLETALRPHRGIAGYETRILSLDHSMWFHKPFQADEWLLHVMQSPRASNGRGLVLGQIFTRDGELVVTTAQEGVIRKIDNSKLKPKSKL